MQTSNNGLAEICMSEGASTTKYLDSVGVYTIGIGATASEIPDLRNWDWDKELSLQEVFNMFRQGLIKYEDAVNAALLVEAEQWQFDALVSICYNIGTSGLTHSSFMKRINEGASDQEIRDAIMAWNRPREIIGRREREANLYIDGVYSNNGKMELIYVSPTTHHEIPRMSQEIDITEYL